MLNLQIKTNPKKHHYKLIIKAKSEAGCYSTIMYWSHKTLICCIKQKHTELQ